MNDHQSESQPEIDLFHFLQPLTCLLTRVWKGIKYYFRKLSANSFLFFLIIILFAIAGALLRYVKAPAYKTGAIFISHVIPAGICTEMLNRLNSPELSMGGELQIGDAAAATLKEIHSKRLEPINLHRTYDSLLYFNSDSLQNIEVTLLLTDFKYIDTIQNALIRYLDNTPYSRSRSLSRRNALLSLRAELVKKLESMDSVQLLVNNSLGYKREYANGDPINPMDGYEATIRYNKQKIAIDQELETMDNIELLQPFTRYQKFNYPDYLQLFLIALAAGLVASLILTPLLGKKPKKE